MSETCNQSCNTCSDDCSERKATPDDFREPLHELSQVKKVIGIVSGKGGVGKSSVTSMLSVSMNRQGFSTAILDADITGPSIPRAFGIKERATGNEWGLLPVKSNTGIQIMSINLVLENDSDPVIWRGPVISGVVMQFWKEVIWSDIDYMFIDMPPGTGDVSLTVFQSIPMDGIIIVTSPQELVSMIVSKAVNMAKTMNIPILGIVENMAYFQCPDCDKKYQLFGDSHINEIAKQHHINVFAQLPIDSKIASACDNGLIEQFDSNYLDEIVQTLKQI